MRAIVYRFLLASLSSCLVACGSDDGGSNVATSSCLYRDGSCFELVGPRSSLEGTQDSCILFGGTAGTSCERDDVSGACAFRHEGSRATFYGLSSEALTTAKQLCADNNGVWSAPTTQ